MTPRTAKRRVRFHVTDEILMLDGKEYIGRIGAIGEVWFWSLEWVGHRMASQQTKTRAAARRALLRACAAEKKEKRR